MGTRGAYGFHKDGVDKLTYCHFDSYPEYLGDNMVEFCRTTDRKTMEAIFERIILVSEEEEPTQKQIEECQKYYDPRVSTGAPTEWYALLRSSQGDIEAYKDGLRYMIDNAAFMQDSLFCEWAYVINLTTGMLEVYGGFQREPQDNRYLVEDSDNGYYNVKLLVEFPLDAIPGNWLAIVNEKAGVEDEG